MFTSSMCSIPAATFHVDAPILFCMECSLFSGYRIIRTSMFISKSWLFLQNLINQFANVHVKGCKQYWCLYFVNLKQLHCIRIIIFWSELLLWKVGNSFEILWTIHVCVLIYFSLCKVFILQYAFNDIQHLLGKNLHVPIWRLSWNTDECSCEVDMKFILKHCFNQKHLQVRFLCVHVMLEFFGEICIIACVSLNWVNIGLTGIFVKVTLCII